MPCDCETSDGFKVGTWVARKHDACSKGTLKWEQVQCLEELGFRLINNLLTRRREYVQCMHWAAQVLERDKRPQIDACVRVKGAHVAMYQAESKLYDIIQ